MNNSSLCPAWLSDLNSIIEKMLPKLQESDGGFKDKENGKKGCFSTIEGLYPLLLHPQKEKWAKNIIDGIKYLLKNVTNGNISPAPEYPDIAGDCSVDSMAYGLYVLTLARHYIMDNISEHEESEILLSELNEQVQFCIKYIKENQNEDKGWPLVKSIPLDLKSRTYSTALVIFALSNCEDSDFEECKRDRRTLIIDGVNFLISENRDGEGGWFFSEPQNTDDARLVKLKKKPSVTLTAVVVFSLSHLLRTERKTECDNEIRKVVKEGAKYIYKRIFTTDGVINNSFLVEEYEPVDYPVLNGNSKGIIKKTKGLNDKEGFAYPYEMILPALILTPGYSLKDEGLIALEDFIFKKFKKIGSSQTKSWEIYDFSDKLFALLYYNYIDTLIEEGLDRFVKKANPIRCVIDGHDLCPDVRNVMRGYPYTRYKNFYPIISFLKNVLQKTINTWNKLIWWKKTAVIYSFIIFIAFCVTQCLGFKNAFWLLIGQMLLICFFWIQNHYRQKQEDKTKVKK